MNRLWSIPGLLIFILLCFPLVVVFAVVGIVDVFFWLGTGKQLMDVEGITEKIMFPADWCMKKAGMI